MGGMGLLFGSRTKEESTVEKTTYEYPRCAECNRRLRLCEHDRTRHCGVCDPCRLPVTLAELTDAERHEWAEFLDADLIRRSRFDGSLSFRYTGIKFGFAR